MKVSIDVSAVPAQPVGAGQYVAAVVDVLARRGRVDLALITRTDDEDRWRAMAPAAAIHPLVPVRRPLRLAWEQVSMPRALRSAGVDVHHSPHYTMPERASLPVVVTIHDLTFFDRPDLHERKKVRFFQRAIRVATERSDALVCVSDRTAARLAELLSPRIPIHVIPHGVDHDRFRPANEHEAQADATVLKSLSIEKPYVAFLGTLEPRKNVPGLIRAWTQVAREHPELTLVVAGRPGWGVDDVEAAIDASGLADRIVRTGYVSHDHAPVILRNAACVAYPAFDEGFGLPALEALACGAALVTTADTPMADVSGDAAALVQAGDDAALAGAIAEAVGGGAAIEGRRLLGLQRAAAFTWDAAASAHEQVYASTVR